MMNNKFTTKSQEVLSNALMTAAAAKNPQIEPAHTTQALLEQQDSIAVAVLRAIGVDPAQIIPRLVALLKKFPTTKGDENYQPSFSRDTLEVIQDAQSEAENMGDNYISTEHILLAVAAHKSNSTDSTGEILREAGATHEALLAAIPSIRGNSKVTTADPESTFQALEKFGTDLTVIAASGKLDPVIGRNSEIRRVIQVLSRRTKNNPVLIGEPGVGKTAVVEGLAQRIVAGDVPDSLRGKTLMSLDLSAMVAGAKYRGEFEERLKAVLQEIKDSDGQIVTFIDEIHTVVGAGTSSEGAMDAGNMLKPMLARGELRLIGATTLDEYRENIEKDPALERRFQQVYVGEPSVDDTIGILRGLKERYEAHHKVAIADNALVAAARLSNRYIIGRQLPDKAIDLVDEAASRLRMEIDSAPEEIDQLRRSVDRLTMEELALKEETDPASMERLEILRKDIADKKEELDALNARWEAERSELNKMGDLKAKLDELRSIADKAQRDGDLEEASRILYGEIPALEQKLRKAQDDGGSLNPAELMVSEEVTADDIAEVVSAWTGIPAGRMLKGESEKLLGMEGELGKRLIGQKKAVEAVSDSIRRSRAGLSDPNRPAGSFMFLGPTGTGKTELAKALAEFLFDDERAMVRIDMSEYSEKYTVARLVGAPPGYVGYEEGGQLTEAIRRRPYSVVLLDEIEKAHPEVFDILLQVLDDGRLTDGQGRTVDFTNTILVLTSNLGSQFLIDSAMSAQEKNKSVMEMVSMNFKPEFLNRLDDIIIFEPLTPTELASIVTLQVDNLAERLQERRLTLEVTDAAKDWLAITGYDPAYGARPLRRLIQREIGDRLAKEILSGAVKDGDNVLVDTNGDFTIELSGDSISTDAQKDGNGLIIKVKEKKAARLN